MDDLYTSQTACRVCGISPRTLDYWVTTGVFQPTKVYRGPQRRRTRFLFTLHDLIRLKTIRELRAYGLSLRKIRVATVAMRNLFGTNWHSGWLVTDGKTAFLRQDGFRLQQLTGRNAGQFAFAVVALGDASAHVARRLQAVRAKPFEHQRLRGRVEPYRAEAM